MTRQKRVDIQALKKDIALFKCTKRRNGKIGSNEAVIDYVKRINGYKCVYCHQKLNKNLVKAKVIPTYYVKKRDTLEWVANKYKTSIEQLKALNPELLEKDFEEVKYLRMPSKFGLTPKEYGVVYCNSCGKMKRKLKLDHVEYLQYIQLKKVEARNGITNKLRKEVYSRDGHQCVYCKFVGWKKSPQSQITLDHKNPVSRGGKSTIENLTTSCLYHNLSKQNKNYEEYIRILSDAKRRIL